MDYQVYWEWHAVIVIKWEYSLYNLKVKVRANKYFKILYPPTRSEVAEAISTLFYWKLKIVEISAAAGWIYDGTLG